MKTKLQLYTIVPLDCEHFEEVCADIQEQINSGIATCALFKMTLVPEGDPPVDKAGKLCKAYARFRERLESLGISTGILVQASIGHGWKLSKPFPFQRYVNLTDGEATETVCPYDKGFQDYIYRALRVIAQHRPDHIMIDDDLRLMNRQGAGCACPLHMQRTSEIAGETLTRESFREILFGGAADEAKRGATERAFLQTQRESVLEVAEKMREAIDSVDPALPASFCCVGNNVEFAVEIAEILAGKGNPRVVRINNARYTAVGTRYFSENFFKCRAQLEKLKGKVDLILAETDTCPQNRYSTSASSLHTHFTGSLLEGAKGAKHWITRLASFEPHSGVAYRRILAKNRGFYEALASLEPRLHWRGCRIPVLNEPIWHVIDAKNRGLDRMDGWGQCLLERFGIPMYFSSEDGGVLCMEGNTDRLLSDEEVLRALHGTLLLASDAAQRLTARGFGRYLGVEVRQWQGEVPGFEIAHVTNGRMSAQANMMELVPICADTRAYSTVYHGVDGELPKPLFPGATGYRNALGGTVFVFCGTPQTPYGLGAAFSYLNETRKKQLIQMLSATDALPVYYPNDEEIYLRAADVDDGSLFCALFNLGGDVIEETELVVHRPIKEILRLMPDGSFSKVEFSAQERGLVLKESCRPLDPLILILR